MLCTCECTRYAAAYSIICLDNSIALHRDESCLHPRDADMIRPSSLWNPRYAVNQISRSLRFDPRSQPSLYMRARLAKIPDRTFIPLQIIPTYLHHYFLTQTFAPASASQPGKYPQSLALIGPPSSHKSNTGHLEHGVSANALPGPLL